MKRLLLLTIAFLLLHSATAQPYYFRHYQVENGLSNNTVYCSTQDKAGFLWFGTKEGLNRFDGYQFKLFDLDEESARLVAPDRIVSLLADHEGTLWVGAQKGLYRFEAEQERLVRLADSLRDVNNLLRDVTGQLWFTAGTTPCRYNPATNTIKTFSSSRYFQATSICQTVDGTVWFGTTDGYLKKFDAKTETFQSYDVFAHSPEASSRFIQKLYAAGQDSIFIGTSSQGIKLFQTSISRYTDLLTFNKDKTTIFVRDIAEYGPGEFWFATETGIFILRRDGAFTNLKKKPLDPYSLSDNAVYTLYKDREGGMWVGTYFGGINYYPKPNSAFRKYFPDNTGNTLGGSVVREICEDGTGNMWIGTEDGGLNKLHKKTGTITQFRPTGAPGSIAYSNIHGLLAVGNELWIGTFEHGLDVLDIRTGKVLRHYNAGQGRAKLKNNFVVSLLQTSTGVILVGTANGVYRYNPNNDGFEHLPFLPSYGFISALLEDSSKTIWIGTHNSGLFYFNLLTQQHGVFKNMAGNRNSLANNTINAIYEDSRRNLWLATEGGGLCKLDAGRKDFTRYTTAEGLPGNFVFKVVEDGYKKIWISTSKGLAQLSPETGAVDVYTKANGLLSDQFNYNSGYRDKEGTLYFGSAKGMIAFRPDAFVKRRVDPPLYITGFQVYGKEADNAKHGVLKKSILYTSQISLPYDQSSFSIDVAALSYTAPQTTTYSYVMKGLENSRTVLPSNHKIYFTNLAPGRYTFQVAAAINGCWSPNEKTLHIEIRPPLWATTWAYVLYAVITILLSYYLFRSYHTHLDDKKQKELYEAKLEFFTNVTHEIRTPLTLIKGPVENLMELTDAVPEISEDVSTLNRATNRLLALINQILDFRKVENKKYSLYFSKVHIANLMQQEWEAFKPQAKKRGLRCSLELPSEAVYAFADEEALQKIFDNLYANAVKYAGSELHITLHPPKRHETTCTIEIRNDGTLIPAEARERIFESFSRLKGDEKPTGTGIGLTLARALAELHGGRLYLKEPSDGFNTFVFVLPLRHAATEAQQLSEDLKSFSIK